MLRESAALLPSPLLRSQSPSPSVTPHGMVRQARAGGCKPQRSADSPGSRQHLRDSPSPQAPPREFPLRASVAFVV